MHKGLILLTMKKIKFRKQDDEAIKQIAEDTQEKWEFEETLTLKQITNNE